MEKQAEADSMAKAIVFLTFMFIVESYVECMREGQSTGSMTLSITR
ncbi:hypothetical protein LT85_3259 [Collimonas arenae]|uniref:Uncharacterized protein n=1 Tax=Collimonas arenae TaxID=279058 RepID=A0A0A1FHP1_9BURK|nr:hypothetical protein LT85_3259 [Collimonas arenae]